MRRLLPLMLVVVFLVTGCVKQPIEVSPPGPRSEMLQGSEPTPKLEPTNIPTLTSNATPEPIPTPTLTPELPRVTSTFTIEGRPFRFVGGFVPGWHWGEVWSEATDEDLIESARENGITVLHLMLPQFERPLGVYQEAELAKLDHFIDSASRHGVYVMVSFIHAYAIAIQTDEAYYHPRGIEGLMTDKRLTEAFEKRMAVLITRRNTINGREYREDPTILGWILADEPISAPWNYPKGAPQVTVSQLNRWLDDMASYAKSLDPNHLVTVFVTAAIDTLGNDWVKSLDIASLDFLYGEDADMRILRYFSRDAPDNYPLRLFSFDKSVVIMVNFASGAWDQSVIGKDYVWQAQMLNDAFHGYFEVGATGVVVSSWGSTLYGSVPSFDEDYNYTASNEPVSRVLRLVAEELASSP